MKNYIKIFSAVLLTALMAVTLTACEESSPSVSETSGTAFENHTIMPKVSEAEEETETELPAADFDGGFYDDEDYEIRENDEYEYKVYTDHIVLTDYLGDEAVVEIPAEIDGLKVTEIGEDAFSFCDELKSVSIPDSISEIKKYAFSYCEKLESIAIPDSVKEIGEDAFSGCINLAEISLPENVEIGDYAFQSTAWIENQSRPIIINGKLILWDTAEGDVVIPDGVTRICGEAFFKCREMTSVTIPDSVKEIGGSAFQNCSLLKSVTIPDSVEIIEMAAFAYCESLEEIIIPESVAKIESVSFRECFKLKNVTIPDSFDNDMLKEIFDDTHWYKKLCYETYVECRQNEEYEYDVYEDHIVLLKYQGYEEQPDIPAEIDGISVTEIGDRAFMFKSLTNVTIPNSITNIGTSAFANNVLTEVTIPESVTVLGEFAFSSCKYLTDVTVSEHFDDETIRLAFKGTPWYKENYGEDDIF